jgi:hypothetical protein
MKTFVPMNVSLPESESAGQPEPVHRFTYASGSRPLEGYTIKRGVGRGGFGEVYFAISDAGKEVALKLIRRNLDVELRGVTHCLNLKHPNLVALYDIRNDTQGDRWVVMEYVSGQSLDQVIEQHPDGMPIDSVLHWFHGISAGVGYLHDHGIVHRDMKPANLFLDHWASAGEAGEGEVGDREGTVKIGDYGLSKFISCSRRSGQTESVGTVHYMAPEIANGRYGREIDIYALGIILYEMLTGHVPFEGESVGEVLMKHLTAEPNLSALAEPYRTIVRRAMAKDPDQRISSIAEIRQLLPEAPRMPPIAMAHTPATERIRRSRGTAGVRDRLAAAMTEEEPIVTGLRAFWRQAEARYHNNPMPPFFKVVLISLLCTGIALSFETWMPMLLTAGFFYLMYRAVRAVVVQPGEVAARPPIPARPQVPADDRQTRVTRAAAEVRNPDVRRTSRLPWKGRRQAWRKQQARQLAARPVRERLTQLCGSMLTASVIATVLALLASFFVGGQFDLAMTLWIALVSMLGSWAIMISAKITEGWLEDQAPRRFAQLVLGGLVGVAAWGLANMLLVALPMSDQLGIRPGEGVFNQLLGMKESELWNGRDLMGASRLSLPVYAGYFAILFVLLKWWRQAEFLRAVRVNFWSVLWYALVAWGLHFLWWFPQPTGLLLAGVIAFTVQLSSPWLSASRRQEWMGQTPPDEQGGVAV